MKKRKKVIVDEKRREKKEPTSQKPVNDLEKSDLTFVDKDGKTKPQIPY